MQFVISGFHCNKNDDVGFLFFFKIYLTVEEFEDSIRVTEFRASFCARRLERPVCDHHLVPAAERAVHSTVGHDLPLLQVGKDDSKDPLP